MNSNQKDKKLGFFRRVQKKKVDMLGRKDFFPGVTSFSGITSHFSGRAARLGRSR
jgi:hypothetical protein